MEFIKQSKKELIIKAKSLLKSPISDTFEDKHEDFFNNIKGFEWFIKWQNVQFENDIDDFVNENNMNKKVDCQCFFLHR